MAIFNLGDDQFKCFMNRDIKTVLKNAYTTYDVNDWDSFFFKEKQHNILLIQTTKQIVYIK